MPAASQDLETSNLLTCSLNKHSVSQPWTSSCCKNAQNFSTGKMPRETCSNFHYFIFQAGMPLPWISYIFAVTLQNCQCPLTPSSLLSLDTAYHPVGDHLLQRQLLKLFLNDRSEFQRTQQDTTLICRILGFVSVPILKHSACLGWHLSFSFFSFFRGQLSSPEGFKEPVGSQGRGLAQGKGHHPMHLHG